MPEIVDGGGEHRQRDAPGREVKAPRARQAEESDRDAVGAGPAAPGEEALPGDDPPAQEHGEPDARIRHQVRRDPERVAPDQDMPLDVPLDAPAADELGDEQSPQRRAAQAGG